MEGLGCDLAMDGNDDGVVAGHGRMDSDRRMIKQLTDG